MHGNAFLTPGETQLFGGGGLDVDLIQRDLQILGNALTHVLDMRGHLRRLGYDGGIDIADAVALGLDQAKHMTQQHTAIGALERRVIVGEMLADIAEGHRTEQRIAQGMQQHIAVRMGNQSATVGNTHPAQGNEVALANAK